MGIEENARTLTVEMAEAVGFDHAGYADISKMKFLTEVRDMCAVNKCGNYDTSWSCPPACGTLEEIAERVKTYDYAMILQSTEEMEDDFDWEAIERATLRCGESLRKLTDRLKDKGVQVLPMGSGGCKKCDSCTYPDAPCRFPEELSPSMEACGLMVTNECQRAGLKYYYGPRTMTFNATIFVKER